MTIDLWAARLERPLTEQEMERMLRLMPAKRRERLGRLQREEKHREPLCAYAMLRLALRERYGWRAWPEIMVTERGKPWFPEHPKVHFSLSHTEGAVLAGVSDQPIGVDIERIRPVGQRTMSQVAGVTTETEFFRSWVRREARTKRSGSGITAMLRSDPPMEPGEAYQEVVLFPGYAAGIAACGDVPEIRLQVVSLEELLMSAAN